MMHNKGYITTNNEYEKIEKYLGNHFVEAEMLDLLEEYFGASMISPEYFDKFIKDTIEIQSLVQFIKYNKENIENNISYPLNKKKFDNEELIEFLA